MYAILAMGFQGNLSMAQTYYTAAKPDVYKRQVEDTKDIIIYKFFAAIGIKNGKCIFISRYRQNIADYKFKAHIHTVCYGCINDSSLGVD